MRSVIQKLKFRVNGFIIDRRVQKNAEYILRTIDAVMRKQEVDNWFVDFGTMLGIARDGKILNHDGDIDIGMLYSDTNRLKTDCVKSDLLSYGIELKGINYYNDVETIMKFIYKKTSIDLHLYFEEADRLATYLHVTAGQLPIDERTAKKHVNKLTCSKIVGFTEKEIYGITVPVPQNYETILSEKYGPTWRIRDKKWKSSQTPNIERMPDYGIAAKMR